MAEPADELPGDVLIVASTGVFPLLLRVPVDLLWKRGLSVVTLDATTHTTNSEQEIISTSDSRRGSCLWASSMIKGIRIIVTILALNGSQPLICLPL